MLQRLAHGKLPEKHHTALRDEEGRLLYEECLTRDGFEGPYTLMYHRARARRRFIRAAPWMLPRR